MNKQTIIDILSQYQAITLPETSISAAVMIILLITEKNDLEIVLTKRAATLPTYAGDYCFPGGIKDPNDSDLYATAAREVAEELNLSANFYQPIGQLDDFHDHEGHLVRPFVILIRKDNFEKMHKESANEITDIYYFPVTKLIDIDDDPLLHHITHRRPSYSYINGPVFIWGLTATMLVHLGNILGVMSKPIGKSASSHPLS